MSDRKSRTVLTTEQKERLFQLTRDRSNSNASIIQAMSEEFGIEISAANVTRYKYMDSLDGSTAAASAASSASSASASASVASTKPTTGSSKKQPSAAKKLEAKPKNVPPTRPLTPKDESKLASLLQKLFQELRCKKGITPAVCPCAVAACATAMSENKQEDLETYTQGFPSTWARSFMKQHKIKPSVAEMGGGGKPRSHVPHLTEMVVEGVTFSSELSIFKYSHPSIKPSNVYNMDEFSTVLEVDRTSGWVMPGNPPPQLAPGDDGSRKTITAAITTSCDGRVLSLQFIYEGDRQQPYPYTTSATEASTVTNRAGNLVTTPPVLKCSRPESHLQDTTTLKAWCDHFEQLACAARASPEEPILLLLDAEHHHTTLLQVENPGIVEGWAKKNIFVQFLPSMLSNLFQPAEQYFVDHIKEESKDEYFLAMFDGEVSFDHVNSKKRNDPKVNAISKATAGCPKDLITAAYAVTGIEHRLFPRDESNESRAEGDTLFGAYMNVFQNVGGENLFTAIMFLGGRQMPREEAAKEAGREAVAKGAAAAPKRDRAPLAEHDANEQQQQQPLTKKPNTKDNDSEAIAAAAAAPSGAPAEDDENLLLKRVDV